MFSHGVSTNTTPDTYGWLGGTGKPSGKINKDMDNTIKPKSNDIADDWSHEIYFYNINPFSNKFIRKMDSSEYSWDNQSIPDIRKINFPFGKCKSFEKVVIIGTHPNIDLVF